MLREFAAPKLNLGGTEYDPPIAVDMQRWFEFNFWLVEELLDLEAKFKHDKRRQERSPSVRCVSDRVEGNSI